MDTAQSCPEDSSSKASLQQTTIKPEIKEEAADAAAGPPAATLTPFSSTSSTSAASDAQNACVRDKSGKKEGTQSHDKGDAPLKTVGECHAESNAESVPSAAEKVAKQTLKEAEEKPKKKLPRSSGAANAAAPKKRSKPKVAGTEKEPEVGGGGGAGPTIPPKEENKVVSAKTEVEEPQVEIPDPRSSAAEAHQPPCSPSPVQPKEDNHGKETGESNMENCGSRKSERRCKGALYKTLVSEGMLTSLRANIDRGVYPSLRTG